MSGHLEAENAQLREEVERLRAIVYPAPPPPPAAEPGRQRFYLITVDTNEELAPHLAHVMLTSIRRQIPEADWQVAHRVEDIPEGGEGVLMHETLRQMWDAGRKEIRWYRRKGDTLQRLPSRTELDRILAESKARSKLQDRKIEQTIRERFGQGEVRKYRQAVNRKRLERRLGK